MLFKKKKKELQTFVEGEVIVLEMVNDPVFSQKMMGEGFAIKPVQNTIYACGDGVVTALFASNHAIGLTLNDGVEILIHIGIDTVNENGKGFKTLVDMNHKVKQGDPLIIFEREALIEKGYDVTTMCVFTNPNTYSDLKVNTGETLKKTEIVATYS